jgi:hypothetical protein
MDHRTDVGREPGHFLGASLAISGQQLRHDANERLPWAAERVPMVDRLTA